MTQIIAAADPERQVNKLLAWLYVNRQDLYSAHTDLAETFIDLLEGLAPAGDRPFEQPGQSLELGTCQRIVTRIGDWLIANRPTDYLADPHLTNADTAIALLNRWLRGWEGE